ncbi:hypothetical protein EH240_30830 [Mesorhizobium tamadayense]|uniref:Uncharacterized protein n=1 Tax=Mesorhizobium tamadayense TaxID=425306 RepID=A0A3P3F5T7_9HYPH|nr:hypothetical protein [Mesorhizobium tamadayense]RRH92938.1 hypothetical protein EH240_30830 [Mesorhizobium tamadayense]
MIKGIRIATVLLVVFWQPAFAENPSLEQCTCTQASRSGAFVTNATACWLTIDTEIQWCDITVQTLEDPTSSTSQTVATIFDNMDDVDTLVKLFQEEFTRFAASAEARSGGRLDIQKAKETVPTQLADNRAKIGECVLAFRDASFGKGGMNLSGNENFRCGVGEASGWLRIEFRVGDVWLAYALSPGRKAVP